MALDIIGCILVLPSPNAGPADFTLSSSSRGLSIPQGRSASSRILVMPRGAFSGDVEVTASGLPEGVTATFSPARNGAARTMTLTESNAAVPTTTTFNITGESGGESHSVTATVTITPIIAGTIPVDLSSAYNVTGIYSDGKKFADDASLDRAAMPCLRINSGRNRSGAEWSSD